MFRIFKKIKNRFLYSEEKEQEYLKKVKENPYFLEKITHPSEKVCLAAVEKNGLVLEYVQKQND